MKRTAIGGVWVLLLLAGACKGAEQPPARTKPNAVRRPQPAPPSVAVPKGSTAGPDAGAGPAVGNPLRRLRSSPGHRRMVRLARTLLAQIDAGRCAEAARRAPEVGAAIRKIAGPSFLSLKVEEMAARIQADPHLMDGPFMRYKAKLHGLAVGFDFVPMGVAAAARKPKATQRACAAFATSLKALLGR